MNGGFVKIYGSKLITSSLWDEAPEVRLVFLGMLAIADATGFVDIPNERALARVLNLEPNYVERGLSVLMAPDDGSRTSAHEGRRVLREESGWRCVNYEKYREFRSAAQEAVRLRVAKFRANRNESNDTSNAVTLEAEAKAKAEDPPIPPKGGKARAFKAYTPDFEAFWSSLSNRRGLKGKAFNAWRKIPSPDAAAAARRWELYLQTERCRSGYVQDVSTWLNGRGWEQDPDPSEFKANHASAPPRPAETFAERAEREREERNLLARAKALGMR